MPLVLAYPHRARRSKSPAAGLGWSAVELLEVGDGDQLWADAGPLVTPAPAGCSVSRSRGQLLAKRGRYLEPI